MNIKILIKSITGAILNKSPKINNIVLSVVLPMNSALSRMKNRGTDVKTVIDVGGSDGRWSEMAMRYFPNAFYFIIEANKTHEKVLMKMAGKFENLAYVIAAAAGKVDEVYFDSSDPFGGLASHTQTEKEFIICPSTTIDFQVRRNDLKPPFMLKLDTHGFEVPILEGAIERH